MNDTPESASSEAPAWRHRRHYSAQFKSEVVQACLVAGATTRGVAQRYGLRRDLVGRWLLRHPRQTQASGPTFVAWAPTPEQSPADSSPRLVAPEPVRITCSRGDRDICVEWRTYEGAIGELSGNFQFANAPQNAKRRALGSPSGEMIRVSLPRGICRPNQN